MSTFSILFLATTHNATAFGDLANITSDLSPSTARPSSDAHITITLHNHNNRSLTVTSVDLQIYADSSFVAPDTHYHLFTGSAVVPSQGEQDFSIDARLPNYLGYCSAIVSFGGFLQGDSNISIGIATSSIFLDPTIPPSFSSLLPLIVIGAILVIAVIAVVVYVVLKKH